MKRSQRMIPLSVFVDAGICVLFVVQQQENLLYLTYVETGLDDY